MSLFRLCTPALLWGSRPELATHSLEDRDRVLELLSPSTPATIYVALAMR
jgi:hypothetical protein